jgi:hypothetical protein
MSDQARLIVVVYCEGLVSNFLKLRDDCAHNINVFECADNRTAEDLLRQVFAGHEPGKAPKWELVLMRNPAPKTNRNPIPICATAKGFEMTGTTGSSRKPISELAFTLCSLTVSAQAVLTNS